MSQHRAIGRIVAAVILLSISAGAGAALGAELHVAAGAGDEAGVQALLAANADVDQRDGGGRTR
jgi:hypothetical protein